MSDPIDIAVVGHTNAGKTSLLRTLTRHVGFGEVSDMPGTTRHVESVDLKVNGISAVRFFDTPGIEDSIALLDYLKQLNDCVTPPDRVRAFLKGPEARGMFEQEAKVLRKILEADAIIYVIDTREPVLPKFRAEIEILTSCAKPTLPVLNFVRHQYSRKDDWLETLFAYNLHAYVQFDAVAPFVGAEKELYQDLAILLRERRATLTAVIKDLDTQFQERRSAGCRLIAALLVDMTALRREIDQNDIAAATEKAEFIQKFRDAVVAKVRRGIDDLLQIYGFRQEDADVAALPWLDGRWEADLFNPETLREASKRLGAGAAIGAALGLAADIALAGISLGAASMIGAAVGSVASQGWGQLGRKMMNKARGVQELTLENEVLLVVAEHMVNLLWALEERGHAAMDRIIVSPVLPEAVNQKSKLLISALQPARSHPEWESTGRREHGGNARRRAFIEEISQSVKNIILLKAATP